MSNICKYLSPSVYSAFRAAFLITQSCQVFKMVYQYCFFGKLMRDRLSDCRSSLIGICTLMLAPDCERSAWGRCSMKYFPWCTHPLSPHPPTLLAWDQIIGPPPAGPSCCPSPSSSWSLFPHNTSEQKLPWHCNKWCMGGERGRDSSRKARFVEHEGTYKTNSAYFWPFFRLSIHTCANAQLKMYENADTINPGTQLTFNSR